MKWVRAKFTNQPLGTAIDLVGVLGATIIFLVTLLMLSVGIGHAQTGTTSLTLTWDANPTTDQVVGYRIFRGTLDCAAQGPLQPLNDLFGSQVTVLSPSTTYKDNSVPAINGRYCYEITAYNAGNLESGRSNRASIDLFINPPSAPQNLRVAIP